MTFLVDERSAAQSANSSIWSPHCSEQGDVLGTNPDAFAARPKLSLAANV